MEIGVVHVPGRLSYISMDSTMLHTTYQIRYNITDLTHYINEYLESYDTCFLTE
jgi:hypothetical protein